MTQRLRQGQVTADDVVFQIKGEWYLVPFFILEELSDELSISDDVAADKLRHWLNDLNKSYLYLETILQNYGHLLQSFILYTLDDGRDTRPAETNV